MMLSNRFAFVALAAASIAAAAAGGYVAMRQNAMSPSPVAAAAPPATTAPMAVFPQETAPAGPVEQTSATAPDVVARAAVPAAVPERAVPAAIYRRSQVPGRATQPTRSAAAARATGAAAPPPMSPAERPAAGGHAEMAPALLPSSPLPALTTIEPEPAALFEGYADDHAAPDPPSVPEPPARTFEELVVPADSVIGLQTETTISSEHARVEDRVEAHVSRDVRAGGKVAIPSGTRAIGSVTQVESGGKFKERARLGVRFHTLVMADGTQLPISTETITRDGDRPASAQKIGGGAVAGAILGAILGGSKGATIGGAAGAGAGAAAAAAADRNAAALYAGEPITVRMLSPVTVTIER